MITFLNLKSSLKEIIPAFCLFGNDRWVKLKAVADIMKAYSISNDGFGVEKLDEPDYRQIEQSCLTGNLFGTKKAVICENFVFPHGKQMSETVEKLSRLIQSDDGSFCLIFLADTNSGFDKVAEITSVCCDKLDSSDIVRWIVAYGKRQGVIVDSTVARKICDYCLQDMSRIERETQKLVDYGEVSEQSVDLLVHRDTEFAVFNLSKTITAKNAGAAEELYRGLIASGEDPRGIFALLYNFYRRAYYVKTSDLSNEKLAELLNVKPFAVARAADIAAKYKAMQLKRILDLFDSADKKIKNFLDEDEVMTTLIMEIICI